MSPATGTNFAFGSYANFSARCYRDMGISITKTLVIWAFPSHIILAIWVRVTGDAQKAGMPISQ